jgi:cytoskeletal protein CcmA (bactofilin family)
MNDPRRRLFDLDSASTTVIGAESVFVGNIRGAAQFIVSGEVHGDGEIEGGLNLAVTGVWNGCIRANHAIVAGTITGELAVRDRLEIRHTAVIRGRVTARTVAIARGAIIEGDIEVTSGEPVLEFEEKRDR